MFSRIRSLHTTWLLKLLMTPTSVKRWELPSKAMWTLVRFIFRSWPTKGQLCCLEFPGIPSFSAMIEERRHGILRPSRFSCWVLGLLLALWLGPKFLLLEFGGAKVLWWVGGIDLGWVSSVFLCSYGSPLRRLLRWALYFFSLHSVSWFNSWFRFDEKYKLFHDSFAVCFCFTGSV